MTTSYTFTPTDATRLAGQKLVKLINEIHAKLPTQSLVDSIPADYPKILSNFPSYGADMHIDRPVFSIAGVMFFRRYNDDWSSLVMYYEQYGWKMLDSQKLTAIHSLIHSKHYSKITSGEMEIILKS